MGRVFCSSCLYWVDNIIKARLNIQIAEDEEDSQEEQEEKEKEEGDKIEEIEKKNDIEEQDMSMDAEKLIDETYEAMQHTYEEINYDKVTPKRLYPDLHAVEKEQEEKKEKKDIVCFLLKRGNCRFGERCHYKHPKICHNYEIYGKCASLDGNMSEGKDCKYNKKCRFMHPIEMKNENQNRIINEKYEERKKELKMKEKNKQKIRYEMPTQKVEASAPKYIERKQCIYDAKGWCKYGDNCKFTHRVNKYEEGTKQCIYDARGWCKFGDNCKFKHKMNKFESGRANVLEKLDFLMAEYMEMKRMTYQNRKETWENPY